MTQTNTSPIIVFGSVRAGTTMFRMMLGSHPDLVEIGENRYLVDCLAPGRQGNLIYDLDRLQMDRVFRMRNLTLPAGLNGMPLVADLINQLRQGRTGPGVLTFHADIAVLEQLFPDARYLHIVRDPRDVAKSVVGFGWAGNVYYGADHWLASEASWETFRATADPARYAEVVYEDLIVDPQHHLKRVCDFLGVAFDPAMLGYNKRSTYDKPDPTMRQRWRKTLRPREVAWVEARCGALMDKRGYTRENTAGQAIGSVEKVYLMIDNKLRKIAAAIRIFGLRDYALEKIYRISIFKSYHHSLTLRMQDKINQSLK